MDASTKENARNRVYFLQSLS